MIGTIGVVASNQLTQEYTTILSQSNVALSGVRPTYVNQLKQDKLVRDLKQDGSWNEIDVLYIFANDESNGNFALLNWINPSLYSLTKINSPEFYPNRGYGSVNSTNFLSSSWGPSNGVKFQQNNASFGGMIYDTPGTAGSPLIGLQQPAVAAQSPVYLVPRNASTFRTTLNSATRNATSVPQNFMARKVLGAFRSASANYEQFYPSSSVVNSFTTVSATSATRSTLKVNILSANDLANRLYGGTNTASMAWFGGYEIRNKLTTFTSSMMTYINSI